MRGWIFLGREIFRRDVDQIRACILYVAECHNRRRYPLRRTPYIGSWRASSCFMAATLFGCGCSRRAASTLGSTLGRRDRYGGFEDARTCISRNQLRRRCRRVWPRGWCGFTQLQLCRSFCAVYDYLESIRSCCLTVIAWRHGSVLAIVFPSSNSIASRSEQYRLTRFEARRQICWRVDRPVEYSSTLTDCSWHNARSNRRW